MKLSFEDVQEGLQPPETAPRSKPKRERRVMDVLIVEDEAVIAKDIDLIVRELGHRVAGPARTQDEAVALARVVRPSVIITDVRLADGSSGVVAVDQILETVDAAVIFVTAAPQWLLTGEADPFFVIPKPYSPETVKAAVARATSKKAQSLEMIQATKSAVSRLTRKQ